jgi:DnaJ family protein C protein 25
MLDNPEFYYQNYYRYFRRKGPKVDIRLVIFSTISVISLAQYFVKKARYREAVDYFVTVSTSMLNTHTFLLLYCLYF